ncbi:hypothetical protein H0B56_12275 [Haloechinothrix sp. YIM 98757]|uniref:Uncharacterized protein n=2 Tax=Haloechinothrix aidingensis TaxID=2752311 RepID=A0A838AAP7_9PSEU|nr:hypothetical protein [Haloechinothrix aidingensis]
MTDRVDGRSPADDGAGCSVSLVRAALLAVAAVLTAIGLHLLAGATTAAEPEAEPIPGSPVVEVSTDSPSPTVIPRGAVGDG